MSLYTYVLNNPLKYTDPTGNVAAKIDVGETGGEWSAEDVKAVRTVLKETEEINKKDKGREPQQHERDDKKSSQRSWSQKAKEWLGKAGEWLDEFRKSGQDENLIDKLTAKWLNLPHVGKTLSFEQARQLAMLDTWAMGSAMGMSGGIKNVGKATISEGSGLIKKAISRWTTGRSEYWKKRAAEAIEGEFSLNDLERMRQGKSPLHPEIGVPKELHHEIPQREGGTHDPSNLKEVWPWEHEKIDPYRHYKGPRPIEE